MKSCDKSQHSKDRSRPKSIENRYSYRKTDLFILASGLYITSGMRSLAAGWDQFSACVI
jgi:hypothetical protein